MYVCMDVCMYVCMYVCRVWDQTGRYRLDPSGTFPCVPRRKSSVARLGIEENDGAEARPDCECTGFEPKAFALGRGTSAYCPVTTPLLLTARLLLWENDSQHGKEGETRPTPPTTSSHPRGSSGRAAGHHHVASARTKIDTMLA